jgi:hypothetical protein
MFLYTTKIILVWQIKLENIIRIKQKIYGRLTFKKMYFLVRENKIH